MRLSDVHRKTVAEHVSKVIIVRQNLVTKQRVASQITPHNTSVDEFGTSIILHFGKANYLVLVCTHKYEAFKLLHLLPTVTKIIAEYLDEVNYMIAVILTFLS